MAVASILAQKGREVVTAPPDRSLQDVATILAERKIGAIVITNNEGKVLGMIFEKPREGPPCVITSFQAELGSGVV